MTETPETLAALHYPEIIEVKDEDSGEWIAGGAGMVADPKGYQGGEWVPREVSERIELERDAHFEVLRQVADLFGITDWDSTTLVQQLRAEKEELEGLQEKGM